MSMALHPARRSALGVKHGRHHPDIKDAEVVRLYKDGVSPQGIAKRFSCSDVAIRKRLKRLGIAIRKQMPWTKDEDAILLELYQKEGVASVTTATGRSANAVKVRARLLGVRAPKNRRQDISTDRLVKMYMDDGMSSIEIASELSCSKWIVLRRLRSSGIDPRDEEKKRLDGLGMHDAQIITMYVDEGMSSLAVAEALGVTVSKVVSRLGANSIRMRTPKESHPVMDGYPLRAAAALACYRRDNYICRRCGRTLPVHEDQVAHIKKKAAHHIVYRSYAKRLGMSLEQVHDLANMITLCHGCHVHAHRQFSELLTIEYPVKANTFAMAVT